MTEMTMQEKFDELYEELYDDVMRLGGVNLKEEPMMTLRRIRNVTIDAGNLAMFPVKSEKFELLYKQVMKQFKPFEDMETIENPRLVKRHIKKVVETARSLG